MLCKAAKLFFLSRRIRSDALMRFFGVSDTGALGDRIVGIGPEGFCMRAKIPSFLPVLMQICIKIGI